MIRTENIQVNHSEKTSIPWVPVAQVGRTLWDVIGPGTRVFFYSHPGHTSPILIQRTEPIQPTDILSLSLYHGIRFSL